MAKKKQVEPVPRYQLLCAIQNTPEDARFLMGIAVNEHEDFLNGLCLNKSRHFTRCQLLDQVERSDFQMFPSILERDNHLLITPRLYVWKNSINHCPWWSEKSLPVVEHTDWCWKPTIHSGIRLPLP